MSKMGQELEDRLDANKYELLRCCKRLSELIQYPLAISKEAWQFERENMEQVLAKIEGGRTREEILDRTLDKHGYYDCV